MEHSIWYIILITLSSCATLKALFNHLQTPYKKLPPGPVLIPIITSFQWLRKSFADLEPTLINLKRKYGPIITLSIGHRKFILITSSILVHQALIQNGAIFADRPPPSETLKINSSNQHNISGASYGPLWRLLRRNLTLYILHPSKIKSFSPARKWVLNMIEKSIQKESNSGHDPVLVGEHLQFGTDTTSTALQWVMANLVKHQELQSKLYDEIRTLDSDLDEIQEENLKKLSYLKAIILEGLRRHPPGHFVLPHAVTQDVTLDGYIIPKEAIVNVMVAEIGWDPKVWEDPTVFKPERFLNQHNGMLNEELSDVTGNKEVNMIPFGAGRRMCPAFGLAMLHLEYFVVNFIKEFKWTAKVGDDIDLSEKQEFTTVMKYPLWAHVSPREEED
ncbi:hypothetical protein C5167_004575 [Papaver somniferum]|uniref:Cytochrome P450 n=1 Tax=Papaver somniferum TaxID=3469 RepID=A0A4Y7JBZ8_PAPSO|nr:hypothetical protein C5167_004575 [Papaver somniferum]